MTAPDDLQEAAATSLREALTRLGMRVADLSATNLTHEQQGIVNGMKADMDSANTAVGALTANVNPEGS